jgi:hypothetical protein
MQLPSIQEICGSILEFISDILTEIFYNFHQCFIQGGSYLCWLVHGAMLHGDRCTTVCEAHTNFADESVCLMAITFEIKEVINFVDPLMALCFTVSSVVHVWEFAYSLSAVLQQLSAPLGICSQLVSRVVHHGAVCFRATCISVWHLWNTYLLESISKNVDIIFVMKEFPADKQCTVWWINLISGILNRQEAKT